MLRKIFKIHGLFINKLLAGLMLFLLLATWQLNNCQFSLLPNNFMLQNVANHTLFTEFSNSEGDLIRRIFTGVNDLPFVDFLLVNDVSNNLIAIILDTNTTFFNNDQFNNFNELGVLPNASLLHLVKLVLLMVVFTLITIFFINNIKPDNNKLLLAYILSLIWNSFSYNRSLFFSRTV